MCQFIETIKIKNKKISNLSLHNKRFNATRASFFSQKNPLSLENFIEIPSNLDNSLYKFRIVYDKNGVIDTSINPYIPKKVNSLKIVHSDNIDYSYKYANRSDLEHLYTQRESCDDILIIKHNFVTDTYFANIVFFDGESWYTPSTFLLNGTKRQSLLEQGVVSERKILLSDIKEYKACSLINAMLDIGEIQFSTSNIKY